MKKFKLLFEKRVLKDLRKVSDKDLERVLSGFDKLKSNPRCFGSKKLLGKEGFYRFRQGDYRIIYIVDEKNKVVRIILVTHRKEAYRKFH